MCMQHVLLAVLAGVAAGLGNYVIEDLGFRFCTFMERHGQMKRFAPGTKRLFQVRSNERLSRPHISSNTP